MRRDTAGTEDVGEDIGFRTIPIGGEEVVLVGDAAGRDDEGGKTLVIELGGVFSDANVIGAEDEHGVGWNGLVPELMKIEDEGGAALGLLGHRVDGVSRKIHSEPIYFVCDSQNFFRSFRCRLGRAQ